MCSQNLAQLPGDWQPTGPAARGLGTAELRACWRACLAAALLLGTLRCGGTSNPGSAPTVPSSTPVSAEPILVGAGDIALCPGGNQEATALLLDSIGGTVFTAGDNVYFGPTLEKYRECYGPSWGRHLSRTRPVPGNHDYESPGPATYFAYFGEAAGEPGLGYYSYDIASWHVIALNAMMSIAPGSAQHAWLQEDLAKSTARCTAAYLHYPLFSSGPNGSNLAVRDAWRLLYNAGAEIVMNGDDHLYERFAPQDPDGRADPSRGIRQFTVGTGGAELYSFGTIAANSEARASVHGVLKLTLQSAGYTWEFIPVAGQSFRDSGSGSCH